MRAFIVGRLLKLATPCLLALLPVAGFAQEYAVSRVPDSLLKDSRAVMREEEMILEIKSPARAVLKERSVFTIMNERGDNLGGFTDTYSKLTTLGALTGILYDEQGKELKRVKKKDMEDRSYVAAGTLYDDIRYKAHNFYYRNYPYTVEYQSEEEMNGLLFFPAWKPLLNYGISTVHSRYVIIAPKDYEVRYKTLNYSGLPVITESGDKRIYTWEIRNLGARTRETWSPEWREIAPSVLFAPSQFEAEGYKGDMSSWESFGKFINQLLAGRDVLPEETRKKVHELTDNLKTEREKIDVLYNFLQKNTHYISIQLGIGGWQPFPADYVAAKKYGDCKALSNYMVALLKEAGIGARYVIIYGGDDVPELVADFPSIQGNHAICCVPMGRDTVWLECTSQTVSPGYMGSFTGGRKAILIDANGGHIVRTPDYSARENASRRIIEAVIEASGDLDAEVNTVYSGVLQERPHRLLNELSGEEREKYLNSLLNLPTYKVEKSHYEELRGDIPKMKEYLHILSTGYASVSGKRLFINPNLFDRSRIRLPADSVRKYDLIYDESFLTTDSITIRIPGGYRAESVPQDLHIDSPYGKYTATTKVMPDRIVFYRSREKWEGRFPPSKYQELVKFFERIYQSDYSRIVLVKQDQ